MDVKTEQLLIDVLNEINKPKDSIMKDYIRPILIALTPVIIIGLYGMATYNRNIETMIRELKIQHINDMTNISSKQRNIVNKTNYNFSVVEEALGEHAIKVNVIEVD